MVTGGWSEQAIQMLDSLTLCATWRVVMVMIEGKGGEDRPEVKIVDTTTDEVCHVTCSLVHSSISNS